MSTEKPQNGLFLKIKGFWLKYEQKIVLLFGLILIAVLAFEIGVLKGQKTSKSALIIEKPAQCAGMPNSPENSQKTQNLTSGDVSTRIGEENPKNCQFVASKNSDKYHLATCSNAKRIKTENRLCFSTEQEAIDKGLKKASCCFK
jgi:hypothetical protein